MKPGSKSQLFTDSGGKENPNPNFCKVKKKNKSKKKKSHSQPLDENNPNISDSDLSDNDTDNMDVDNDSEPSASTSGIPTSNQFAALSKSSSYSSMTDKLILKLAGKLSEKPITNSHKRSVNNISDDPEGVSQSKKATISNESENDTPTLKSDNAKPPILDSLKKNRYSQTNQGPFFFHIQSSTSPPSAVHPLLVGKLLSRQNIGKGMVEEIKKVGFSKVAVKVKNRDVANRVVSDQILSKNNLVTYIPNFRITRQGIVRNIPIDFSIEDIQEGIEPSFKVCEIRRLNRRITSLDDKGEHSFKFVPSRTLLFTFLDQILPKYIYIYNTRYEVSHFVPRTSICFACLRFGHVAQQCKSKPRCKHCSEIDHTEENCPNSMSPPLCINCKNNHKSLDKNCPAFLKQREIQSFAAAHNISIQEARENLRLNSTQSFNTDFSNISNFPFLPNGLSSPQSGGSSPNSNQSHKMSYAQAAASYNNSNNLGHSPSVNPAFNMAQSSGPSPIGPSRTNQFYGRNYNPINNSHANTPILPKKRNNVTHTDNPPPSLFYNFNTRNQDHLPNGCGYPPQSSSIPRPDCTDAYVPPQPDSQAQLLFSLFAQFLSAFFNANIPSILNSPLMFQNNSENLPSISQDRLPGPSNISYNG